jgi:hypothetical protein
MRKVKIKNPLTKTEKIRSVKLKFRSVKMVYSLGKHKIPLCQKRKSSRYKWTIRSVKMVNPLGKNGKYAL